MTAITLTDLHLLWVCFYDFKTFWLYASRLKAPIYCIFIIIWLYALGLIEELVMTLVLTQHEEGCVPFHRCRACSVADIILESYTTELQKIFNATTNNVEFDPGNHLSGCSPIDPCINCKSVASLKRALRPESFERLLELMDDGKSLEVWRQEQEPSYAAMKKILMTHIDELEISIRPVICLKNEDIVYVAQLCQKTESELLKIANFGRKALHEIQEVLSRMGLRLGMEISPELLRPS